jgi:integrase
MKTEKIPNRDFDLKSDLERVKKWKISEYDKNLIPKFIRDIEIGKITGNQPCVGALIVYLVTLKNVLEFFGKPSNKVTNKDTERLCEALLKDEIGYYRLKKVDGKVVNERRNYSDGKKMAIKNMAIMYLNWNLKEKADKVIRPLRVKTKIKKKTVDYLSEAQITKLYQAAEDIEDKFLIAVLFDSGARAEEFHNIRRSDIEFPSGNNNFVKITLREEFSKTEGRTISLYWRHSLEAVRDYFEQRKREGMQEEEPVFKKSYRTMRRWVDRFGKKILGRAIHYHLFRHSSATHYATKMNRQELCYRYGWKFSSPMPDIYISRVGAHNKELDEKFEQPKIAELETHLKEIEHKSKLKDEEIQRLKFVVESGAEEMKEVREFVKMLKAQMATS